MFKQILSSASLVTVMVAVTAPVWAQTSEPGTSLLAQNAAPPQAPQVQPTEVSDQEVQQFANAVRQLQAIQEEAQTQAAEVIQGEGLSVERFNEILQTQQNPQAAPTAEISEDEQQSFADALNNVANIQQSARTRMQQAIEGEGLNVQRFNQIFAMVQQDPALQQEIQQELTN